MGKFQKINSVFVLLLLLGMFLSQYSFGQISGLKYQRNVSGVNGRWGSILLPNDMYGKVNDDFSDIRIYSVNTKKDTVETPYWIESMASKPIIEKRNFRLLNSSSNADGSFFTLEGSDKFSVNQLNIDFEQNNFDWKIKVEGSQEQSQWFTLVDDYRVLSISNDQTDYTFTKVKLPEAKYNYYRITIKTSEKTVLKEVSLSYESSTANTSVRYPIATLNNKEDKTNKQSILDVVLHNAVPVNNIQVFAKKNFNYFRTVNIEILADSFKTTKGMEYSYVPLATGVLNSKTENVLNFSNTIIKKFRIVVDNDDNAALTIDSVNVSGSPYRMNVYFLDTAAQYILAYGNPNMRMANYDIEHFKNEIPSNIPTLSLGEERILKQPLSASKESMPLDKKWLWTVILILVALLGYFAFKMLKKVG